jgi:hypothetical protein
MTGCERWQTFRDPFAAPPGPEEAAHLAECELCREALARWRAIEGEVASFRGTETPDPAHEERLLRGIEARISGRREDGIAAAFRPRYAVAVACLAAAVIAIVLVSGGRREAPTAPVVVEAPALTGELLSGLPALRTRISPRVGETFRVPSDSRAILRSDRHSMDVSPGTVLRIARLERGSVRVELDRGTIACDVDFGGRAGAFEVDAAGTSVKVKGTRFSVARNGAAVRVAVDEGRVEVRAGSASRLVRAGEVLESEAGRLSEPHGLDAPVPADVSMEPVASPTAQRQGAATARGSGRAESVAAEVGKSFDGIATWREWVLSGRLAEAEEALVGHLSGHAGDTAAWELLADCRRKAGNGAGSVEAYRRLIAVGAPAEAHLARFKAGVVCQDKLGRQADAADLFGAYLDGARPDEPLRAEALTRRGKALAALGRTEEARRLLAEVVERHGANPVAAEARRILDGLGR